MQAEVARTEYLAAKNQFDNEKQNLDLAQRILDRTVTKQKNGMATSMEVTNANNQYLTTQSNFVQSSARVLTARVSLLKALGKL